MELVRPLAAAERSPLSAARVERHLTIEQVALRAGLTPQEVEWLEEGRIYRFPSQNAALMAVLVYGTAIGITHREARRLAGRGIGTSLRINPVARLVGAAAIAALLSAIAVTLVTPNLHFQRTRTVALGLDPSLPPPWKVSVAVLNGNGDYTWTRTVASRIQALAYRIDKVARADRFDYSRTAVYYEPGGRALGLQLARELGVAVQALPGGSDPRRLIVIVGPHTGPD